MSSSANSVCSPTRINVVLSHVNSYTRASLGNSTPCDEFVKAYGPEARRLLAMLGTVKVPAKDNEPHRDLDTTTYVATTHRMEKFGKLVRAEFDRRFGRIPETTLYITDGSKWLQTVWRNHFPFATPILDVYHALGHLKPMMLGLGIREGSKEWKYRHRYWPECVKAGKTKNVLDYIWKNMRGKLSGDAMREYRYYRGNAGRMKYDEYRANGWFIGPDVIESGCKTVIGQRFKQSGMI